MMLKLLLSCGAKRALEIVKNFKPLFTKEEFLAYQDSVNRSGDRISYTDNEAKVSL
jgi:hypothetical protein